MKNESWDEYYARLRDKSEREDAVMFINACFAATGQHEYYYHLKLLTQRRLIAQSSGDLQDAPWPDGATEFVDLHCGPAIASGARYAVMVVNNYGGLPFSLLERGFAGLMLRDVTSGTHFDPRTVELKFSIDGEHGVFLPLVLDLREQHLHWLDVQSKGQFEMNNVETSGAAITTICPDLITYFESGVRPSMYDVALLHAAARCERVVIRGAEPKHFTRQSGESTAAFHARLVVGRSDSVLPSAAVDDAPTLALLYRGDFEPPEQSGVYALFRERVNPTLSASDLLS